MTNASGGPTSDGALADAAVVQPRSADEVAAALRAAADARHSLVIRGAGTKSGWGRPPGRVDVVLDMRALDRVLAHEHGDMTATVQAGAALADVNRALAQHGQWLPLDPPHADTATIGGVLATNDSGPLRHRYGTPRDMLIGVQLATTDGVLTKAGGRVVKNVAGYDLGKLVTGSFGSLAAIVTATFKLSPLPAVWKTVRAEVAGSKALAGIVRSTMTSQLEPIAFEVAAAASGECRVLLRFASLASAVDAQIDRALAGLTPQATNARVVDGTAEHALWREHAERIWRGGEADDAIVRASWLPADIEQVLGLAPEELIGRAAVGAGLIRIAGDADTQARAVDRLRTSAVVGNVAVVRGSAAMKMRADVWGSAGDRQPVFDALKRAFDPHNVLNAGRGPL
jgi:glycolate oxidase FAD binding subunit